MSFRPSTASELAEIHIFLRIISLLCEWQPNWLPPGSVKSSFSSHVPNKRCVRYKSDKSIVPQSIGHSHVYQSRHSVQKSLLSALICLPFDNSFPQRRSETLLIDLLLNGGSLKGLIGNMPRWAMFMKIISTLIY